MGALSCLSPWDEVRPVAIRKRWQSMSMAMSRTSVAEWKSRGRATEIYGCNDWKSMEGHGDNNRICQSWITAVRDRVANGS